MILFNLIFASLLICLMALFFRTSYKYLYLFLTPFLVGFSFALTVPIGFTQTIPWLLFGLHFKVDFIAKVFLLFTSFVWLVSAAYALMTLPLKHKKRFIFWFLLTYLGNIILCMSNDVISFYLFFSLMSLSAFGVIVHDQTKEAKKASFVYLKYAILGELAIFFGLIPLVLNAGTMRFSEFETMEISWEFWLILIGFGIKIGVFLLHRWLPLAHSNAPAPASAVLSAVMLKAGVLGWLRFFEPYIQLNETVGMIFLVLGVLGILLGILGVFEQKIKTVLAYSSISQMGFIVIMFGVLFYAPQHQHAITLALLFFMIHHSFNKSALFLLCHEIKTHGLQTVQFVFALIAAMSLIGLPFTSGAVAKTVLKNEVDSFFIEAIFFIGSTITALLMLRFFMLAKQIALHSTQKNTGVMIVFPLISSALFIAYVVDFNYEFKISAIVTLFIAIFLYVQFKEQMNHSLRFLSLNEFDLLKAFKQMVKKYTLSYSFSVHPESKTSWLEKKLHQESTVFAILLCFIMLSLLLFLL